MNTLLDLLKFNRERASRHIIKSNRRWWIAGLAVATVFVVSLVCARIASATPSSTYWAPSVATCQAKYVPHITYDTYGGYVSAGLYHGTNDVLFTNSDGKIAKTGAILGAASPDVSVGLKGLKKVLVVGDVQTCLLYTSDA